MRPITSNLRAALYALTTDEGLLVFITVAHPTAFTTLRFSSDSFLRSVGGDDYEPGLPKWAFPSDAEDDEGVVSLSIEAVSVVGRALVAAVRLLQDDQGTVQLDFRRLKDPTTVEATMTLTLATAKYDDQWAVLELSQDALLDEQYGDAFTPDLWPALFQ